MITDSLEDCVLHNAYLRRLKQGRDIRVIVSAENAATGVGKTTVAVVLALLWDIYGWTADRGTLDPKEYTVKYHEVPPGSVLLLDEAEKGLERRRSMKKEVLDVGHAFATLRFRQVAGVLTLPSRSMMDKRIAEKLCDYWVVCSEDPIGEARVYEFGYNEVIDQPYKRHVETFKWPTLESHPEYQKLDRKKVQQMEGKAKSNYVHRDEFEDLKENYWSKAAQKRTYELVNTFYDLYGGHGGDLGQQDIAEAVGTDQSTVSRVVNSDSFEDWYSPDSTALEGHA